MAECNKMKETEAKGYWAGIYKEPWLAPKIDADPEGRQYLDFWAGYAAGRGIVQDILSEEAASLQEEGTFPFGCPDCKESDAGNCYACAWQR